MTSTATLGMQSHKTTNLQAEAQQVEPINPEQIGIKFVFQMSSITLDISADRSYYSGENDIGLFSDSTLDGPILDHWGLQIEAN